MNPYLGGMPWASTSATGSPALDAAIATYPASPASLWSSQPVAQLPAYNFFTPSPPFAPTAPVLNAKFNQIENAILYIASTGIVSIQKASTGGYTFTSGGGVPMTGMTLTFAAAKVGDLFLVWFSVNNLGAGNDVQLDGSDNGAGATALQGTPQVNGTAGPFFGGCSGSWVCAAAGSTIIYPKAYYTGTASTVQATFFGVQYRAP
jgi:hypothetical protein